MTLKPGLFGKFMPGVNTLWEMHEKGNGFSIWATGDNSDWQ